MANPEPLDVLRQNWGRLVERYRVGAAAAAPVFDLLLAAYSAPERHYHNLEHLVEALSAAARLSTITCDLSIVQLAIWFHDAVYDSRASNNEARSAELAVQLLAPIGVPGPDLDRLTRLILATAHLSAAVPAGDRETSTLLDADLAVLAADPDRYRRYAEDVRREYWWAADEDYRAGRLKVLDHFLSRPRIYRSDLAHAEWDGAARANLRAEASELKSGALPPQP